MEGGTVDFKASKAEALQPDPSSQAANAVQRNSYSRRLLGQNAAWRTALWVGFATALVFLVMKCAVELSINRSASARVLAAGGGDWDDGDRRPLLQGDPDKGEAACGEGSRVGGSGLRRRRRPPSAKRWWPSYPRVQQGPPTEEYEMLLAPDSGPSTSASGPGGIADQGNEPVPAGRRVEHQTELLFGDPMSPHYAHVERSYGFPRLEGKHPRLKKLLETLQYLLRNLYDNHQGPYDREFQIHSSLKNHSGGIAFHIRIQELNFSNEGVIEGLVDLFRPARTGVQWRHVLAEAEETGSGRFTETVKHLALWRLSS